MSPDAEKPPIRMRLSKQEHEDLLRAVSEFRVAEAKCKSGCTDAPSLTVTFRNRTILECDLMCSIDRNNRMLRMFDDLISRLSSEGLSYDKPSKYMVETGRFYLVWKPERREFALQIGGEKEKRMMPIPREWLIPREAASRKERRAVSSIKYDRNIASFPIGHGLIGLHISSFDIHDGGTIEAAAGRDVFLIFNPDTLRVTKGNIDLGVTKERVRHGGCFFAKASHFLLADVNEDGFSDIGVVREEMGCDERYDDEADMDVMTGPFYEQRPVRWYVFRKDRWVHDPSNDGNLDVRYEELPLIGMVMSPLDFAAHVTWKSYDPSRWKSRGEKHSKYIPSYRDRLISLPRYFPNERRGNGY